MRMFDFHEEGRRIATGHKIFGADTNGIGDPGLQAEEDTNINHLQVGMLKVEGPKGRILSGIAIWSWCA